MEDKSKGQDKSNKKETGTSKVDVSNLEKLDPTTIKVDDTSSTKKDIEESMNKTLIPDELTWGLNYRTQKSSERRKRVPPKRSPIDIPFKICREQNRLSRTPKEITDFTSSPCLESSYRKEKSQKSRLNKSKTEPTLLERQTMSQKEYMDLLSIPNYFTPKRKCKKKRRRCCKCELEPCPPRIVELAVPNKRLVWENWKQYLHVLTTEQIAYLNDLLHTNQNLELKDARYYFKQLDRMKRKAQRRRLRAKRRRKKEKERGDRLWLNKEIEVMASTIVDYIKNEPLYNLNFNQMMMSNCLMEKLENQNIMRTPKRTTKNTFKKTVIEISDKLAVWIDSLVKFVDIYNVQSEEQIGEIPSLYSIMYEGEEEEEGESEESEESWLSTDYDFGEGEYEGEGEDLMTDLFGDEFEGMDGLDLDDFLNQLSEDMLEKLIRILANCSDDFLMREVDPQKMPGITYADILEKLRMLRDGLRPDTIGDKLFLEEVMIDWAKRNEPESVDDKLLDKIHETARILAEWLMLQGDRGKGFGADGGDGGDGRDGRDGDDGGFGLDGADGAGLGVDMDDIRKGILDPLLEVSSTSDTDDLTDEERRRRALEDEFDTLGAQDQEGLTGVDIKQDFDPNIADLLVRSSEGFDIDEWGGEDEEGFGEDGEGFGEGEGEGEEGLGIDGDLGDMAGVIKGHKPSVVFEHSPDTVCCLSLKIWAVWLLEITHNAHNWTKWITNVIRKVREFAAIVRGDITEPDGQKKVLYKAEWRKFAKETEEQIVSWRQYSMHVKDLTNKIIENFHGKKVNCCPKCLQDHLIKNVVTAHETLQALTEAMNCAGYWQRCLDEILEQTAKLTSLDVTGGEAGREGEADSRSMSTGESLYEIEEIFHCGQLLVRDNVSDESIYEIEELDPGTSGRCTHR